MPDDHRKDESSHTLRKPGKEASSNYALINRLYAYTVTMSPWKKLVIRDRRVYVCVTGAIISFITAVGY